MITARIPKDQRNSSKTQQQSPKFYFPLPEACGADGFEEDFSLHHCPLSLGGMARKGHLTQAFSTEPGQAWPQTMAGVWAVCFQGLSLLF